MSVGVVRFAGMKKIRVGGALVVASLLALQILNRFPQTNPFHLKYLNSTAAFLTLGISFFFVMKFLNLHVLRYLSPPRNLRSLVGALIPMGFLLYLELRGNTWESRGSSELVRGGIFLLALGFGEEILSRGFIFGVLRKYGLYWATMISSLIFGLLHINRYINDWDPWRALTLVTSATGFGVFACGLMLLTGSIWVPIIFHAIANVGLVFKPDYSGVIPQLPFNFAVILNSLAQASIYAVIGLLLVWISNGAKLSRIPPVFIKWGLTTDGTESLHIAPSTQEISA